MSVFHAPYNSADDDVDCDGHVEHDAGEGEDGGSDDGFDDDGGRDDGVGDDDNLNPACWHEVGIPCS